jgi:hypothetical protein
MSYHVAYDGQTGAGKTTAAIWTSREAWRLAGRRSIVADPNPTNWGPQALVYRGAAQFEAFWAKVWSSYNCNIYVDEVATMMPRDQDMNEVFTRVRHNGHQLHVLLHHANLLLPMQRGALGTLFLFNNIVGSTRIFAEEWNDERILQAASLPRFKFLLCRKFAGADGFHSVLPGVFPKP